MITILQISSPVYGSGGGSDPSLISINSCELEEVNKASFLNNSDAAFVMIDSIWILVWETFTLIRHLVAFKSKVDRCLILTL
jgi:hypothetical protein